MAVIKQKILEKEIQLAICDYLAYKRDIMFWRQNTSPIHADGKFRSMPKYSKTGVPDIIVIKNGIFIGLEVKRPKHKQSETQIEFQTELEKAGGKYYVVTSIDDVKSIGL
jgi:hypothetical protein